MRKQDPKFDMLNIFIQDIFFKSFYRYIDHHRYKCLKDSLLRMMVQEPLVGLSKQGMMSCCRINNQDLKFDKLKFFILNS